MLTVDDILPLIGTRLNEHGIEALFSAHGQKYSDELDPGHPEDQRHYYGIPAYSVEMILGDGDVIDAVFFHLSEYPWSLRNGLGRGSPRESVVAKMGAPERSGRGLNGGWDRFKVGNVLLHFEYEAGCESTTRITAMSPATAP